MQIHGLASGRILKLFFEEQELDENLLQWLRSRGITIASSCDGDGVCKKCTIQNGWLTCELTLREFLKLAPQGIIEVSYL
jgi:hypothetical protein